MKNAAEISELCHKMDEPIYVTKNGYGDMVIMSMEVYEKTMNKMQMYYELELSERQIEEGKVNDAKDALSALKEKYEL